jgi:ABC-type transport system involved in multi-copper enzyme maturation permease subunit
MSATSTSAPLRPGSATHVAVTRVPFGRLLRVELSKLTASRSSGWLLAAIGAVLLAVVAGKLLLAEPDDLTFGGFLEVTSTPMSLLLPLLAVLAVTTEWSQRTALNTFTLEPSRLRVVLAKLVAVLVVGLLAVVAALTSAAVGNVAGTALGDGSGAWTLALSDVREVVLTQQLAMVQAFAFGLLLLNTAGAIVLYYLIAPAVSTVLTLVDGLAGVAPWLDLSTALTPLSEGSVSAQDAAQLASAATLWVLLPLGLGLVRLLRGEVKPD